ncbi:MAG: cob(I)yrinic acid a,c-diamide adenosyltransferase [Candidatus Thalassarchaeaceae archaeon]|nr:cob(I)yrinic acid a,c-diamide adenosyltransferase [Candidatus Thalassarchaeaceae archaeon]
MVRITKVHTGGGDTGKTSLLDGKRVGKENLRVGVYGTIDELNSQIGVIRMELNRCGKSDFSDEADEKLGIIQQELFDIGGECSCTPGMLPPQMALIGMEQCDRLVAEMDNWLDDLSPLTSFIMPTGSAPVATMHVARTVTRRAERKVCEIISIDGEDAIRTEIICYLNRLSDWLFVLGRWFTEKNREVEVLWTPLGKR